MKRHILAAILAMLCSLVVVGTAAAWDTQTPPPAPPLSHTQQGQGNASDQSQVQVVPIAPQLNVQNVNVGTGGDVRQGEANNANTGQANQQQNTQVAVQQGGGESKDTPCSCSQWQPATPASGGQSVDQHQGNGSDQQQVQVVPIAPQANVQNVNVLTSGDVSQGDANNANTGQANQQHGTQAAVQKGSGGPSDGGCECSSQQPPDTGSGDPSVNQHQGNWSSQKQIQVVPIAPQLNVQNVNVGTGGKVRQGDANNANTGQANQQHDTQIAVQQDRGKADSCRSEAPWLPGPPTSTSDQSVSQHQGNWSKQKQAQVVPIAPQANIQNVNLLTFGSVWQGDANNANTGQANQQENTQIAWEQERLLHGGPTPA